MSHLCQSTLFCLLLFLPTGVLAQIIDTSEVHNIKSINEQRLEFLAAGNDGEGDEAAQQDFLSYCLEYPLDLNTAHVEELLQLGLSPFQIQSLITYKIKFGPLERITEIQAVPGFDHATIIIIAPYVRVGGQNFPPGITFRSLVKEGRKQLVLRTQRVLQPAAGFLKNKKKNGNVAPPAFLGDPYKLYSRFRFNYNNKILLGITCEKDPGETFFGPEQSGFDFNSAHLFVNLNKGFVRSVALVDYQVHYGQGMAMWSGVGFGKSPDVLNIRKTGQGIRPYTATNENMYFRGAAFVFGYKQFEGLVFYSSKNTDARLVQNDSLIEDSGVSGLLPTGLHRTIAEISNRQSLPVTNIGVHLVFKKKNFSIGGGLIKTHYEFPFNSHDQPYKKFDFTGTENINLSIDFSYSHENYTFFGEGGRSGNGGVAGLAGMVLGLDSKLSMACLIRNYGMDYQAPFAKGFGERFKTVNEQGVYTGIQYKPLSGLTLMLYLDLFKFPFIYYQNVAPSVGYEWLLQLHYTPSKKLQMYISTKFCEKQKNNTNGPGPMHHVSVLNQNTIRCHFHYNISKDLQVQSRLEATFLTHEGAQSENGFLMYQELVYNPMEHYLSFNFRYTIFDTDSYASRLYAYEKDLLYVFSIPAYFYRGDAFYLNIQAKVLHNVSLGMGFHVLRYDNKKNVGSGVNGIEGPVKSEIKIQLKMEF